jgi:hypothetical protein
MLPIVAAVAVSLAADTLPVPDGYRTALEAGTRDRSGAPGAAYWQQRAEYVIRTRLLPDEHRVSGSETVAYHNRSPDRLGEIWLNLPQNVFAPGNPRNRTAPVTGGFEIRRLTVQGVARTLAPSRGGASPGTVARVELAEPLPPGGTAVLEIDWSFEVPEGTFRMGREGSEVFFLAQWYPQVAVYDDLRGWVRDPYMGNGEFYLEYGDFQVEITTPEGWLVGASGVLENPAEVLTPEAAQRLASVSPGSVLSVVTVEDREAGRATAAGGVEGTLTWRYSAHNVRDFAWGASDRYVWDGTVAEVPDETGSVRHADIHVLYRPERENWDQAAQYARHAIESHSRWYPYPYPQMTVNEGVIGGGMEYPMITIIGGGRSPISLYSVISHELAHMWWPMVAGSDERRWAWIDEGLASFAEDLDTPTMFQGVNSGLNTMNGYLRIAGTDSETESMRPTDLVGPFGNRGTAAYGKPASVFRALRSVLGDSVFDEAMRAYLSRWAYKHPDPLDLFWTFEDVSGQDLDWFFHPWLYTTRVLDQAVASVSQQGTRVTVVLEDRGEIPMPVVVEIESESGSSARVMVGHDAWEGRSVTLHVDIPDRVREVTVDPEERFPDVNRENNRWARGIR